MDTSTLKNYFQVVIGTAIYVCAVNLFIVPLGLYNAGLLGIAQIIRTILVEYLHLQFSFDIAGIINFLLNLPLFILAFHTISKRFVIGTFISVLSQAILFSLIPIPAEPILNDMLSCILIGSCLAAAGVGLCLTAEACAGGTDILGMYASLYWKHMSVGKITIAINIGIYLVCAILFNIQVALYSALFSIFFGIVVDKMHLQNIALNVMIFTKRPDVSQMILHEMHRGVTCWEGEGAYTKDHTHILVTVISKYELERLRNNLHELDPNAFVIVNKTTEVFGGFEKRLVR
ncbi:MAG: YitT family protein [Erysipelotrichaceae bacterium]|nr:YitT family protein [Erysipelotrichaceae bacterium]